MKDLLKPYLESAVRFVWSRRLTAIFACGVVAGFWFYADFFTDNPLNRYEMVGLFLISIAIALVLKFLADRAKSWITLLFVSLVAMPSDAVWASDLQVFDISQSGAYDFDLRQPALYRFAFSMAELQPGPWYGQAPQETDCLTYTRTGFDNFSARFCGYADAFDGRITSILIDPRNNPIYAYDLINLEAGGGGNFGRVFELPSTGLRDYFDASALEIEGLSRAFLPSDYDGFRQSYTGYGLYSFVLFRENSLSGFERRREVASAFQQILPDLYVDAFGVERSDMGLVIYPTNLDHNQLYQEFNLESQCRLTENSASEVCQPSYFVQHYNYAYSQFALRAIRDQTGQSIPAMSIVFVPQSAANAQERFFLSRFDWSQAFLVDLDDVDDIEGFFIDLNNALVFDLFDEPPSLMDKVRRLAESTGRFALMALGEN